MNKKILTLVLINVLLLTSCMNKTSSDKNKDEAPSSIASEAMSTSSETFDFLDNEQVVALNNRIVQNNITQEEGVIDLYVPQQEQNEGNYSYTVSKNTIDIDTNEYTVVETGLPDDSIEGIQTIITIKNNNNLPVVLSIKKNYRCYRGHKEWSAEKCD